MRRCLPLLILALALPSIAYPPPYPPVAPIVAPDKSHLVAGHLLASIGKADDIDEWRAFMRENSIGNVGFYTPTDAMLDATIDAYHARVALADAQSTFDAYYGPIQAAHDARAAMHSAARQVLPLLDELEHYAAILRQIDDGTAPRKAHFVDGRESSIQIVRFAARDGSGLRAYDETQFDDARRILTGILHNIRTDIRPLISPHGFPNTEPITRDAITAYFDKLYAAAGATIATNDRPTTERLSKAAYFAQQDATRTYRALLNSIAALDRDGWILSNAHTEAPPDNTSATFVIIGTATNTAAHTRSITFDFALFDDKHVRRALRSVTLHDVRANETAQYELKVYDQHIASVELAAITSD